MFWLVSFLWKNIFYLLISIFMIWMAFQVFMFQIMLQDE